MSATCHKRSTSLRSPRKWARRSTPNCCARARLLSSVTPYPANNTWTFSGNFVRARNTQAWFFCSVKRATCSNTKSSSPTPSTTLARSWRSTSPLFTLGSATPFSITRSVTPLGTRFSINSFVPSDMQITPSYIPYTPLSMSEVSQCLPRVLNVECSVVTSALPFLP